MYRAKSAVFSAAVTAGVRDTTGGGGKKTHREKRKHPTKIPLSSHTLPMLLPFRRGGTADAGEAAGGRGAYARGHRTPEGIVGRVFARVYCSCVCVLCNFDPRDTLRGLYLHVFGCIYVVYKSERGKGFAPLPLSGFFGMCSKHYYVFPHWVGAVLQMRAGLHCVTHYADVKKSADCACHSVVSLSLSAGFALHSSSRSKDTCKSIRPLYKVACKSPTTQTP